MSESPAEVFARLSTVHPPRHTPVVLDRALVLGGSIAGLLAARVLADHAQSVVIIERDGPGLPGDARQGVPQGAQVHTLLPGGHRQLERWFPGFTEQAQAGGAVLVPSADMANHVDGVRQVVGREFTLLSSSRPFLEGLIRRRTLELPNVKMVPGRAVGLEFESAAVTGVRYAAGDGEGVERGDFVVDAMGRASRLGDWLQDAGWEKPEMRRSTTDINYATAFFRRDENARPTALLVRRTEKFWSMRTAGAYVTPVEDGRWIMLVAGYDQDRPQRNLDDLLMRCREDLPPRFAEVAAGELLGEIRTYHQADSRRRDFHLLDRLPARLVSVGDAVASFNPIYGQGMSSAALHASCLSEYLCSEPDLTAPARRFFQSQRVVVDAAWEMSTAGDAARRRLETRPPLRERITGWVTEQITTAAVVDRTISARFNDVVFMTAHPNTLATPGTLLRSILANLRHRGGKTG